MESLDADQKKEQTDRGHSKPQTNPNTYEKIGYLGEQR
jgi:hypothetical protein